MIEMNFIKYIYAAILFVLCGLTSSAQFRDGASYQELYDSETVTAFKTHVRALSSSHLEGRKAGSEGEKEAAEYVRSAFKSYGWMCFLLQKAISLESRQKKETR